MDTNWTQIKVLMH